MGDAMAHDALQGIEFTSCPAVLVLADSEAAADRARRSAEAAGCRVSDIVPIAGGAERLARQGFLDAAFVEVEADHGQALDDLVDALEQAARAGTHGSIVSAPAALIDAIAARSSHARVVHLCEASEVERVASVGLVSAREKHRLHDIGKEDGSPQLRQLSEEVGRIAQLLSLAAEQQNAEAQDARQGAEGKDKPVDACAVRAVIRARRHRDKHFRAAFGSDLFADPAWDILLDLFASKLKKKRVAVSSLCIAAAVPPTTALRWIKTLTDLKIVLRDADTQDGRRVYIELAPQYVAVMDAYFRAAQRISPLLL